MEKILLAVDDSKKAEKAAEKAGKLAGALEAEVTIITVIDAVNIHHSLYSTYSHLEVDKLREQRKNKIKEEGEKILRKAANLLQGKGIKENKITKMMKKGSPAEDICEEAEKNNYDLIILADTGEGGVKRFLLGSTSDRVVRHAETSVMIVK